MTISRIKIQPLLLTVLQTFKVSGTTNTAAKRSKNSVFSVISVVKMLDILCPLT